MEGRESGRKEEGKGDTKQKDRSTGDSIEMFMQRVLLSDDIHS